MDIYAKTFKIGNSIRGGSGGIKTVFRVFALKTSVIKVLT
jgi:hypothetical protein